MSFAQFKRLSFWEKIAALGSIASIIGLALFFFPSNDAKTPLSQYQEGTGNTQIGTVQGNLTINSAKQDNKINQKVYSDWGFSSITTQHGTHFCTILSAVINEDIGQNIVIKGDKVSKKVIIDLYKDKWNYKQGTDVNVMFDFSDNQPLTLHAFADGHILDIEIPTQYVAIFLLELVEKSVLQVIFPDNNKEESWFVNSEGTKVAVSTWTACMRNPKLPSSMSFENGDFKHSDD